MVYVQEEKSSSGANTAATMSPVELYVKNAVVQRNETGAFVIGTGSLRHLIIISSI